MKQRAFTPLEKVHPVRKKFSNGTRENSLTGFTLIELIITVTIFSIIVVTVYSSFYMGVKTWRRNEGDRSLQKARLDLLKIEKELKDSFFFSQIPFTGRPQEMSFPLSISEGDSEKVYIITYNVDEDRHTGLKHLTRKQKNFSEAIEKSQEGTKQLLPLMKDIRFEYAHRLDGSSGSFEWKGFWNGEMQDSLPSGVRISLEIDTTGEIYNKVVFIQHGELGVK